tara:strand:- start:836 stop:1345 length:510 start_codon:yes stop_codon:yes gene_type:complete
MGSIKIAGKNIVTQSGSDEPTIASNVVFPAGHIIQLVKFQFTDSDSETGATWQDSPAVISITPQFASSFILVQLFAQLGVDNVQQDTNFSYRIYNTTETDTIYEGKINTSAATGYGYGRAGSSFGGLDISPDSGSNTYRFQYGRNGGSGPISFNPYGKQCVMIAMEIKQ